MAQEAPEKWLNKTTRKTVPFYCYLFLAFPLGKWWLNQMCDLVTAWLRCKSSHTGFSDPQGPRHRARCCWDSPVRRPCRASHDRTWFTGTIPLFRRFAGREARCWEVGTGQRTLGLALWRGGFNSSCRGQLTGHPPGLLQAVPSPNF